MSRHRAKNFLVLALAGTLLVINSGLVVYAPTLYRMFCSQNGYGGTV